MTVASMKAGEGPFTFAGIDKAEHKNLLNYFKSKNVKMRNVDVETNQQIDFGDDEEEEASEEETKKTGDGGALAKRVRKPAKDVQMLDDDYDSEEDESFKDDGSGVASDDAGEAEAGDDEEGEDFEGEDSDDVSMADSDLADEVKQLQKEAPKITGRRRGGAKAQESEEESPKKEKRDKKDKKDKKHKKDKKKSRHE